MSGVRGVRKSPTVSAPYFTHSLTDVYAKAVGCPVALECLVEGYPRPEVVWEKDGKLVGKSRNTHMTRSGSRCVLEIKSLRPTDLGFYKCTAVNIIGTAVARGALFLKGSEKTEKDVQSRNSLKLPHLLVSRSRSAEREGKKTSASIWRSSSINSKFRRGPFPGSLDEESTKVVERLSRPPIKRNDNRQCSKSISDRSPKNFGERLIAKIKIPEVFRRNDARKIGSHTENSVEKVKNFQKDVQICGSERKQNTERNGVPHRFPVLHGNNKSSHYTVGDFSKDKKAVYPDGIGNGSSVIGRVSNGISRVINKSKQPNDGPEWKPLGKDEAKTNLSKMSHSSGIDNASSMNGWTMRPSSETLTKLNGALPVKTGAGRTYPDVAQNGLQIEDTHDMIRETKCKSESTNCVPDGKANVEMIERSDTLPSEDPTEIRRMNKDLCQTEDLHKDSDLEIRDQQEISQYHQRLHMPPKDSPVNVPVELKDTQHSESGFKPSPLSAKNIPVPDIRIAQDSQDDNFYSHEVDDVHSEIVCFVPTENGKDTIRWNPESNQTALNRCTIENPCTGSIKYSTPVIEEECGDLLPDGGDSGQESGSDHEMENAREVEDLQMAVPPAHSPARIDRGPQSVTALRGESVTLAIHFTGVPQPAVMWMKSGTVLNDGGRNSILLGQDMSVLTVTNVTADDSGKYVVCVENERGGDSCFASVAVVGIPEPPGGDPTASDFTDHSLVLSWYGSMYDGGSVVTGYIVEMCRVPERNWQKVTRCMNTSCAVQGLSCGRRYVFRVRVENRYGISHPSRESQTICLDDYLDGNIFRDENVEIPSDPVTIEAGTLFADQYDMQEEIGKGRFGTVFRCIEKSTGRPRAAKMIRCIRGKEKVLQEIDIMNRLHHPKLLKLLAAFENGRNMILVTEFISGGELFERVIADDFVLTESDCVVFVRQICDGVAYMHRCSILHLDLKPENILCKTRTSHQIKIIDFGLARSYREEDNLRILFGTPEFVAPEVISYEPVGPLSDMWSIGVICYVLLSGLSPFMGETDAETFANITRGEVDFDEEAFANISGDAKRFISSVLIKQPRKRISADACLKHPWLMRASWMQGPDLPLSTDKLKKFIIRRKWQKSGTAIRALGRMVSLSKSSLGSSCDSPLGSPSLSRSFLSRSETTDSGDSEVFRDSDSLDLSR